MKNCIGPLIFYAIATLTAATNTNGQPYLRMFEPSAVTLLDSPFKRAQDLNTKTLLQYDVERLLEPYRKEAGLPVTVEGYSNWEGLKGHVGGHYLSALAMTYASTGNDSIRERLNYFVKSLKTCQQTHDQKHAEWGKGYLGGVPDSRLIWSALKEGNFKPYQAAWVPWYNVHKTFAGLRDAWYYAGNQEAKQMFLKLCDWSLSVTAQLSGEQMQSMLETEHGGMNEVLADAYQLTGDAKYLNGARRFSHQALLYPLSRNIDNLDNKHANTQVPKAIGFQRIAELSSDTLFERASQYFWESVATKRSLVFGGNSRREFFPQQDAYTDFLNDVEGPETCNSYNMLKLTAGLHRKNPSAHYLDFYERVLYNHILSSQHPATGGYVYFTPARPRHYRVYSSVNQGMWCCVGSGMENHSKYNEMIYTHRNDSLYVNLFIPSILSWKEKGLKIKQTTTFPLEEKTELSVMEGTGSLTLMIRRPAWVKPESMKILINGKATRLVELSSGYIAVHKVWKKGDRISISLPMRDYVEYLPNVSSSLAFLHGPLVLAAKTGTEDLRGLIADDGRWSHIASGKKLSVEDAPILLDDYPDLLATKLVPVKGKPLTFSFADVNMVHPFKGVLEPFNQIHDSRYIVYWTAMDRTKYTAYLDSVSAHERKRLETLNRTIDFVAPGEQQPEKDHQMQSVNSTSGNRDGKFWREAAGSFSYWMTLEGESEAKLLVRYWGSEWGSRKFAIYIDDTKLATEDNTGRWNKSEYFDVAYEIPVALLKNKNGIRVKFEAIEETVTGAVYDLRLIRLKP